MFTETISSSILSFLLFLHSFMLSSCSLYSIGSLFLYNFCKLKVKITLYCLQRPDPHYHFSGNTYLILVKGYLALSFALAASRTCIWVQSIKNKEKDTRQVLKVKKAFPHPCYDNTSRVNDLMLLKVRWN